MQPARLRPPARRPPHALTGAIWHACAGGRALALLALVIAAPLQAQDGSPDVRAPIVDVEAFDEATAASTQSFVAEVTDDRTLQSVTLHHRRAGEQAFASVPMRPLDGTDRYGASIVTDADDLRSIEYYVQAFDAGGNRTINGFAFDPLRRTLRPAPAPLAAGVPRDEERPPTLSSGRPRWWAVALGVVAVGALASLAGGGSGGDDPGTVPLTIDIPEPVAR